MTGLIDFSPNADENDSAAAPIFWPEGMPAKAVNNSSREEMAALAAPWNLLADRRFGEAGADEDDDARARTEVTRLAFRLAPRGTPGYAAATWQSTLPTPTRAASEAALRNVAEWLDDRPARDGEMRFGWETWEDPFFDDADSRLDVL